MTTPTLDVTFEPPAKGQWISLRDHFPRALTPEYSDILCAAMFAGEAIPFAEYGMPVKTLEVRPVHGHVYVAPAPLLGGYSNSLPPGPLLKLAARLVPAFRRRTKAAERTLATRPWLEVAKRWYATERYDWIARCSALQSVEVDAISDDELVNHLEATRALARAGYERHFSLHGPDLIPTGLLLSCCDDWGVAPEFVLPVLVGSTPASVGRGPELDALRAAVASSGADPDSLDDVRAIAGPELDAFLHQFGSRLVTGYDIDSLSLGELPSLVVQLARPARTHGDVEDSDAALDELRSRIPVEHHAELAERVADARATFGMRDDNGPITGAWPMGLLRRAVLAAGRRLTTAGALEAPTDALEVTVAELGALVRGTGGPSTATVVERKAFRAARSQLEPPLTLGPEVDLPLAALPEPMRKIARAQLILRDTFTVPIGEVRVDLTGDGLGDASYTGTACVAADPADALARLRPGDVLVATGTTPAYNMALSIAGAVVVEEGGLLSHAAVIAREVGLPAVIGAGGCMMSIPDGAMVEVDPRAGKVRVLAVA